MKRTLNHLLVPSILPLAFFIIAATPVEVLGCRNRGLLALLIAVASGLGGLFVTIKGMIGLSRDKADADRWLTTALILAIPPVALVFLA